MAKPEPNVANSDVALAKIRDCIKRIYDGIQKCASLRTNIPTISGNESVEKSDAGQELEACSQKMLSNVVSASMAHDSIIREVAASRESVGHDQEALLKVRLKLDNLIHEKRALEQQINLCQGGRSELLDKLNIPIPSVNTESDELASSAHHAIMTALHDELAKRKQMRQRVESVVKETSAKRRKLVESKSELREIPRAIASLAPSIEPIRKLFSPNESYIGRRDVLPKIHHLPGPLYILCRTASAYRETFGCLEMSTVGEPVTDNARFEAEKAADPYLLHPMQARIDIIGVVNGPKLRIMFRYHVNLQIVTVTSAMVVDGQETPSFPTKELRMLYPFDFGELSPNPNNDLSKHGPFKFDVTKAKEGRPYIWANIICGIPCLPRINSTDGAPGGSYLDWPSVAALYPDNLCFKDVMEALRERLHTIISLKSQIEVLLARKLPVFSQAGKKASEPETKVDEFAKLTPHDVAGDVDVSRPGTNGKYTEIWNMTVSRGELKINCIIGLEPDYPVGPPVFRLKCTSAIPNLSEKDVVELERCVNEYKLEGAQERDMLLGAQVRALCTYIDNLVAVCESIDEGTVESGSREIKGRTRSKRDAILGGGNC